MHISDVFCAIYKLGCLAVTICISYVLFEQYFSNDDTSKVLIKRFAETDRNSFPTITLCLHDGGSNDLYDERHISSSTGLSEGHYRDAMMGRKVNINDSLLQDPEFFQKVTIKLQSYLAKFEVVDVNDENIVEWKQTGNSLISCNKTKY